MRFEIDKNSPEQMYKQIASYIQNLIIEGDIPSGAAIESIRTLADDLGVAPATVKRAYGELEKAKYIETLPGKGSFVCYRGKGNDSAKTSWTAFFSYAHKDNELTGNRLLELAQDIKNAYEFRTGEQINLFTDQEIEWGSFWQDEINQRLNVTAFFIPILTPNYMNSVNCLKELKTVIAHADQIGKRGIIYPIRYVDIDKILEKSSDDELVSFIQSVQRKNWDSLHYSDRGSSEYRLAIKEIVDDLIDADEKMTTVSDIGIMNAESGLKDDGNELGTVDKMAEMENAFLSIQEVLGDLQESLSEISVIANDGTQEMEESDRSQKGFSGRIVIIKKMATRFENISENVYARCGQFTKEFQKIDRGIHVIVPQLYSEIQNGKAEADQVGLFYSQVKDFCSSAKYAFDAVDVLTENLQPAMEASRDLRKPLGKISRALTDLASSRNTINGWLMLMDEYDIEKDAR